MNSDDKLLAIFVMAVFFGGVGAVAIGWPSVLACAVAISAVALSKKSSQ